MTKSEALNYFNGSVSALAESLGITPSAVSQWPDEIPKLRAYQILDLVKSGASGHIKESGKDAA